MYESRHFRSVARRALRGFWGLTIAVTLVASILGSTVSFSAADSGVRVKLKIPENSDYFTPDEYDMLDEYATPDGYVIPTEPILPSVLPRAVQRALTALSNFLASDAGTTVMILLAIAGVVLFVIGGGIQLGLIRYNLDLLTRENPPAFLTLFSRMSIFGRALGLRLMTGILTALWSLLFVIPGIVAAYRYALAPYLMAEHPEMGVMEAISQSKALMRGNKWRLFCLQLSFIGWGMPLHADDGHRQSLARALSQRRRDGLLSGAHGPPGRHALAGHSRGRAAGSTCRKRRRRKTESVQK